MCQTSQKKTGDYASLSATDIKLLSLTFQLEKETVGTGHLCTEPIPRRIKSTTDEEFLDDSVSKLPGFYLPGKTKKVSEENPIDSSFDEEDLHQISLADGSTVSQQSEEDSNDESDEESWITPSNIAEFNKDLPLAQESIDDGKVVPVACVTADFPMQNVLKQMGLQLVSVNGMAIKTVNTFVLKCSACLRTTPIMTKVFCPSCGNKTLMRVPILLDENGDIKLNMSGVKPVTSRGKRFVLPAPKGGKHAVNPQLTEDQHITRMKASRLAGNKTDPLDPNYIAGTNPFAVRDVYSKSSMLGVKPRAQDSAVVSKSECYWMKRNPNQVGKKVKK